MNNKSYCNPVQPKRRGKQRTAILWVAVCIFAFTPQALAGGDAPAWMHVLVNAPVPEHDEKTDAVLMYSETNVTVLSADKIKTLRRKAYKILRPDGRQYGIVEIPYNTPGEKITALHGWSIPASGKDYEVKDKEAIDVAVNGIDGSELIDDSRERIIRIPAPDPGNIIGYEYEIEKHPIVLQDEWKFQREVPVRESHYSLQLPSGWEYKASWLNYPEIQPIPGANNLWQWNISGVKGLKAENDMPPFDGVVGMMIVSYFPPGGPGVDGFRSWQEMGNWYQKLTVGRRDASPEIKQKVAALTTSSTTSLAKMKTIAQFLQQDIRYVAIELGIGGWQPHPAPDIFTHKYGDCKDKATLMASMLHEIGVDSYYISINTERGSITKNSPAYLGFNHVIIAIKLPEGLNDPSVIATMQHPRLGKILFFDPTNQFIPFGQIGGYLQSNWGLLVAPEGGELVELPKQPSAMNSVQRTAKLRLAPNGKLSGDVSEVLVGDKAWEQRERLRTVTRSSDKIKPIESLMADSLTTFQITKATVANPQQTDQPFGFDYSFEAENYAKNAGGLLLVRPRVLGSRSSGILETKEPRKFPIEFDGPEKDTDNFEIVLPPGYEVDDLPPPVDVDYSFASYHSKSEVKGNVIGYTRTFEVKELSVPVNKAEELKKFYRIIYNDERSTAVLKPSGK